MDFRLLGPIEVLAGGQPLRLGGPRQQALLAYLVLRHGEVVQASRLLEELWHEPPAGGVGVVHTNVSRLRRVVGDRIATVGTGYAFRLEESDRLDLAQFRALLAEAGAADEPAQRARQLRAADELWHGTPFDGLDVPFVATEVLGLEELRVSAIEERVEAELDAGHDGDLVAELAALVARYPLRERLREHWILALYRSGRQAEALEAHRETRRMFDAELGLELSPALAALERAILRHDPALDREAAPKPAAARRRPRRRRAVGVVALGTAMVAAGIAAAVVLIRPEAPRGVAETLSFGSKPRRHPALVLASPTSTGGLSMISDTFDGTVIDEQTWYQMGEGTGWTMTQHDGRLEFSFQPGTTSDPHDGVYGGHVGTQCSFPGDFDARVDYTLVHWPASNGVGLSLTAFLGPKPIGWSASRTAIGADQYQGYVAGRYEQAYTQDLRGTLRVARVNGVVTAYYLQGGGWVPIGSSPNGGVASIGLMVLGGEARSVPFNGRPVVVDFDNFHLTAARAHCP